MHTRDDGSDIGSGFQRIADLQCRYTRDKVVPKPLVQRPFDKYPRTAQAYLALIRERRVDRGCQHFVVITIGKDDIRIFTPELERKLLEHRSRVASDLLAGFRAPGKRDCFYIFMAD